MALSGSGGGSGDEDEEDVHEGTNAREMSAVRGALLSDNSTLPPCECTFCACVDVLCILVKCECVCVCTEYVPFTYVSMLRT